MSAFVPPPPPPPPVMTTGMVEELFPEFLSVLLAFSPTIAVFVIVVPAVHVLTVAVRVRVAVEVGHKVPIVHVPVEVAYVPCDDVAETNVSPPGKVSVATTP